MNFLLGGKGVLGRAIIEQFGITNVKIIERMEYLKWSSLNQANNYFKHNGISENDSIFVCAGITNPKSKAEDLDILNFQIPKNILSESYKFGNAVFTFGSIHESFKMKNPYLESKVKLLNFIYSMPKKLNHKHLQLHTVYGINLPKKHMLLGQIYHAIRSGTQLKISSGRQLREYWHAKDIAKILSNIELISKFNQIEPVSSGYPVQIKKLTAFIFEYFNLRGSLEIGGIEDSQNENYDKVMEPRIFDLAEYHRDQLPGVLSYMKECLSGSIDKL